MRVEVRTLIVAVAVVGLGLAAGLEVRNRRARSRFAALEEQARRMAALHERELAVCEAHAGDATYDPADRQWDLDDEFPEVRAARSWSQEATWHSRQVADHRRGAAEYAERGREVERRLILPWTETARRHRDEKLLVR